ncbi:hypothetical protein M409DRAFT_36870 [Zasmidium cellare ATCC 36951]|uniref:Uncharacterized protein n=1 Tax=Zasmidium cellare ATCC 36951 TaxID=1080233 RepID=A0A6A6CEX4_ZASCE|nr:uncharacterized protein M409DRAFT_36870 [Zasmidium cellare ATCC 36951]KAF2165675.1 hypothetical protein M409DRAFT_36870 [Zasmidium cellare ATCC 36951]
MAFRLLLTFLSAIIDNSTQLTNPVTRYNNSYIVPNQSFPGLQSNWHPAPDSGETSYVGTGRLRGRKALITGGDSGIGRAVAIAFAREGADVAFNYLPEEQPDADITTQHISATGRRAHELPGNLRNESFCADLVARAHDALGGLDILVSNAGYSRYHSFIGNMTTAQFNQTFETNVFAPFYLVRAAVSYLPPGSSIIFTSSGEAVVPSANLIDYAATKAVLANFARGLAKQLAPRGIRVNAVAPYMTISNVLSTEGDTTESIREVGRDCPYGRNSQPVELAPLYVTLADPQNSFASGQIWAADGGTGDF